MMSLSEIQIRPLQGAIEARICAEMMANSEPWITLKRGFEFNLKLLEDRTREVYVAVSGEAITGFVVLNLLGPLRGYIQTLAVMPDWRSKGVGRKLMAFAEERIFREGPNVFLCVSSFNNEAQRFYKRLGYEQVGEFKDYVVKGYAELLMRKTTGPLCH
jgi:ribosomal protein S18 acetylase RimI-like enzyme